LKGVEFLIVVIKIIITKQNNNNNNNNNNNSSNSGSSTGRYSRIGFLQGAEIVVIFKEVPTSPTNGIALHMHNYCFLQLFCLVFVSELCTKYNNSVHINSFTCSRSQVMLRVTGNLHNILTVSAK